MSQKKGLKALKVQHLSFKNLLFVEKVVNKNSNGCGVFYGAFTTEVILHNTNTTYST